MPKVTHYNQYVLHAHWYNRLQTAQECAVLLSDFLKHLEKLGSPFSNWDYFNSKDKLEPISLDVEAIRKQLLLPGNGARRGVMPDAIMSIMGFNSLLFSKGANSERVTLSMNYGMNEIRRSNQCRLELPTKGEIATQVLQSETLNKLLKVVVQIWKPDWAVIDYFDPHDSDSSVNCIPVYWFVYLSERRGRIPILPSSCSVSRIEGYGSYVMTTPEPFTRERPDHLEVANQVKAILEQAGLLTTRPT
jgi:hypothetical protein